MTKRGFLRAQGDVVAVVVVVFAAAAVFAAWRLSTPAECAWLGPDAGSWQAGGVVPRVSAGCDLAPGQVVVGATGGDLVLADGTVLAPSSVAPAAWLAQRLAQGAWTMVFTLVPVAICGILVARRPTDRGVGAVVVFTGGLLASTVVAVLGLPPTAAFEGWPRWLFLATTQVVHPLLWGAVLLFAVLFPTPMSPVAERMPHRAAISGAPVLVYLVVASALWLGTSDFVAWAHDAIRAQTVITAFTIGCIIAVVLARMIRLRGDSSDVVARQQVLWLGGTGLSSLALALSFWIVPAALTGHAILPEELIGLPGLLFLGGLGIGVARYRMFDLEWVLVRVLVLTALTLLALGLFGVVTRLGTPILLSGESAVALGVVVVALSASPLRARIERAVNWVVYRDPDDRYRTLSRVGENLAGRSVDFDRVAEDIGRALRLPHVTIAGEHPVASVGLGEPLPGAQIVAFPLTHGTSTLGELAVHTRGRGDRLSAAERDLLRNLARQIGVALHQEALTAELQRSRERLVIAREEERRALRRVLHDDVAPAVASITLQAETARQLVERESEGTEQVRAVLDTIGRAALAASQELRRLAYDLRPPALDDRGLVAALEDHGLRLAPTVVEVDASGLGDLGADPLPTAVEVAAFRIVSAAMANVARHARARRCWVRLARTASALAGEVADDGVGPPEGFRPGVGITSMRERAAELGGELSVSARVGGGTVVRVSLPLEASR